jgi:hypothetical protein
VRTWEQIVERHEIQSLGELDADIPVRELAVWLVIPPREATLRKRFRVGVPTDHDFDREIVKLAHQREGIRVIPPEGGIPPFLAFELRDKRATGDRPYYEVRFMLAGPPQRRSSTFVHAQMLQSVRAAIQAFATKHSKEVLSDFGIDGDLLCFNTVTRLERNLKSPSLCRVFGKRGVRDATGDWAYQGFARLTDEHGFSTPAYERHYELSDPAQRTSAYSRAMNRLASAIEKKRREVFKGLKLAPDFRIVVVPHSY